MKRLALLLAALGLSACTPEQAVWVHFGDTPELHHQARKIVACETGHTWNPRAVNPTSGASGLFQIHPVHRSTFERVTGQAWAARFEPIYNAQFARWLYSEQGWRPWACRSAL